MPFLRKATSGLTAFLRRNRLRLILSLIVFLFIFVYLSDRMFIPVYPGHAAVVWLRFFGGTQNWVWGEGIHYAFPWDVVQVYDVRRQSVATTVKCIAKDGVEVDVQAVIRFEPNRANLPQLQRNYGPDFLTKVVVAEASGEVQAIISQFELEELYTISRSHIQHQIFETAHENISSDFLTITGFNIMEIVLPARVTAAIESKIEERTLTEQYQFTLQKEKLEAERKVIEANGIRDAQQIIGQGLTRDILTYKAIQATLELAKSPNAKIIISGNGKEFPVILGSEPPK